jgi:hypothetical protein
MEEKLFSEVLCPRGSLLPKKKKKGREKRREKKDLSSGYRRLL